MEGRITADLFRLDEGHVKILSAVRSLHFGFIAGGSMIFRLTFVLRSLKFEWESKDKSHNSQFFLLSFIFILQQAALNRFNRPVLHLYLHHLPHHCVYMK